MQLEMVVAKTGGQVLSKRARGVLSSRGCGDVFNKVNRQGFARCVPCHRDINYAKKTAMLCRLTARRTFPRRRWRWSLPRIVLPAPSFQHHLARVKQARAQKLSIFIGLNRLCFFPRIMFYITYPWFISSGVFCTRHRGLVPHDDYHPCVYPHECQADQCIEYEWSPGHAVPVISNPLWAITFWLTVCMKVCVCRDVVVVKNPWGRMCCDSFTDYTDVKLAQKCVI